MINFVQLTFLPGSAGNFFSRCIALASDCCYGWIDSNTTKLNLSLEEKFKLYSYGRTKPDNWVAFEGQLNHYADIHPHHQLPPGSWSIWVYHPDGSGLDHDMMAGADDKLYKFYIDPRNKFEWVFLNALYKNSYIDVQWLKYGKQLLDDDSVIKIELSDIVESADSLLQTVQTVCDIIGIELDDIHKEKINDLWHQWILTTLPESEFQNFKNQIGYYST